MLQILNIGKQTGVKIRSSRKESTEFSMGPTSEPISEPPQEESSWLYNWTFGWFTGGDAVVPAVPIVPIEPGSPARDSFLIVEPDRADEADGTSEAEPSAEPSGWSDETDSMALREEEHYDRMSSRQRGGRVAKPTKARDRRCVCRSDPQACVAPSHKCICPVVEAAGLTGLEWDFGGACSVCGMRYHGDRCRPRGHSCRAHDSMIPDVRTGKLLAHGKRKRSAAVSAARRG